MDWFGRAKIDFVSSAKSLTLQEKDGSFTNLRQVCEKVTPPCQLNPLLFNGHLQTMWTAVNKAGPPIYYKRKIFDADHKTYHGSFAVDFAVNPHDDADETLPPRTAFFSETEFAGIGSEDSRPMLIVLHGLSGGSHEVYLRHSIEPFLAEGENWAVCVVNSRGCANSAITSGVLFNARASWDVRQIVKWARETFPNRPLFGLGFSLGACILTNYVAEEGASCPLKAAVAVGNPFNLEVSSKALQRTLIGREVYQRAMGSNLNLLVNCHKESLKKHTDLDWDELSKFTYLYEFDRLVQTKTWGYPTEDAYYRDAGCADAVMAIRIPFFAISAADDPIAVDEAVPKEEIKQNPYAVLCSTSLGGHVSWFEPGGGRWHAKPISNFLKYLVKNIDLDSIKPAANGHKLDGPKAKTLFEPVRRTLTILDP